MTDIWEVVYNPYAFANLSGSSPAQQYAQMREAQYAQAMYEQQYATQMLQLQDQRNAMAANAMLAQAIAPGPFAAPSRWDYSTACFPHSPNPSGYRTACFPRSPRRAKRLAVALKRFWHRLWFRKRCRYFPLHDNCVTCRWLSMRSRNENSG